MNRRVEIGSGEGSEESPWASEQPVPTTPIEFDWAPADPASPAADPWSERTADAPGGGVGTSTSSTAPGTAPAGTAPPGPGPDRVPDDAEPAPPGHRQGDTSRRRLTIAAAGGILALVVAVLVLVRDDPSLDAPAASGPGVSEPLATDPPGATTPPDTLADPDVLWDTTVPDHGGDESGDGGSTAAEETATWTEETIELPPPVRAIGASTTVVAVTGLGEYVELQLPSGHVDRYPLSPSASSRQLVVGATSTLLAASSGARATSWLVRVGAEPQELTLEPDRNEMIAVPGRDEFVGTIFDFSEGGVFREVRVFADGSTETSEIAERVLPWERRYAPNGDVLANGPGGVYRFGDDGEAVRVSDGDLISASSNHLIVHECSESFECGYVLIDARSDERRPVTISDRLVGFDWNAIVVSPDGQTAHFSEFRSSRGDLVIVDLETGAEIELELFTNGLLGDLWAADSSGLILPPTDGDGLLFIDRDTGVQTVFAEELGRVRLAAVRAAAEPVAMTPAAPITSGLSIIGLGRDGDVHRIDVDTGAVITTTSPPLASGAPAYVFADPEGATIASFDDVPSIRYDAATDTAALATTTPRGTMVPGPLPGTVWVEGRRVRAGDPLTISLVDSLGNELGTVLDVGTDTEVLGSDGTGAVLVRSELGGTFRFAAETAPTRVTAGEVIAIGSSVAYVHECDAQFTCGAFRVDRATGERTPAELPELARTDGGAEVGGPFGQSVSPDGDVLFVPAAGISADWAIVDLAASTSVPAPGAAVGSPMLWSADSQWALYLADDVLHLYDRAGGSLRTLSNLPELKAFGPAVQFAIEPGGESGSGGGESGFGGGGGFGGGIVGGPVSA